MIRIFTSSSNNSSRKVATWLNEAGYPFIERRIKNLLELSKNGFDDLLSVRAFGKINKRNGYRYYLENMTVNQLVRLMIEYPTLLKRPLLVKGKMLIVGYSDQKMRMLIPKESKRAELKLTLEKNQVVTGEVRRTDMKIATCLSSDTRYFEKTNENQK